MKASVRVAEVEAHTWTLAPFRGTGSCSISMSCSGSGCWLASPPAKLATLTTSKRSSPTPEQALSRRASLGQPEH